MAANKNGPEYTAIVQTPVGKLGIVVEHVLTRIEFLNDNVRLYASTQILVVQIVNELNYYFKDPGFKFTIPCQVKGSAFQKRVWSALVRLSVGETITYGALAKQLKTGARAIGNACRTNPLPLLIPCHRVLTQHGLGGFSGGRTGKKLSIKRWLLTYEAA